MELESATCRASTLPTGLSYYLSPASSSKQYLTSGAKSSEGREEAESSGSHTRSVSEASTGDLLELKVSVYLAGGQT